MSRLDDLREFDAKLEAWTKQHSLLAWLVAFGIALLLFGLAVGLLEMLRLLWELTKRF